jgi:hypothetical protein
MHITPAITTTSRRLLAAALAVAIAGGAAACSDDADAATLSDATCTASTAYTAAIAGMPHDPAAMGGYVADEVIPVVTTIVDGLPDDVDATAFTTALGEVAKTGDPTPLFESADAAKAQEAIGAAIHDGCGFGTIDVEAKEYAFGGIPATVDAGPTSLRFRNVGAQEHELVLFRVADGVDTPEEDLLALPEDEQQKVMTFAGVASGRPGTTSYAAIDLKPGRYLAVCFIPVGGGQEGEPHFMHGMHATFTVAE